MSTLAAATLSLALSLPTLGPTGLAASAEPTSNRLASIHTGALGMTGSMTPPTSRQRAPAPKATAHAHGDAPNDTTAFVSAGQPSERAKPGATHRSFVPHWSPSTEVIPVPRPSTTAPFHPLRIRWGITAPVLATTSMGFLFMEGLGPTSPSPQPCTPPEGGTCPDLGRLAPIDSIALGHYNDTAALFSDVFMVASLIGPVAASVAEAVTWSRAERDTGVARHRRRGAARFGYDTAIWAEAIGVAMLTTDVLKAAFDRTRPLTHLGEDELAAQDVEIDGDFARSFPSGHATLAFSSVVAGATLLTLKQCKPGNELRRSGTPRCAPRTTRERTTLGLLWGLGLAGAATTAVLRVVAGKHYPTDVLMGTAIGTTSGLLIPLLHRRAR